MPELIPVAEPVEPVQSPHEPESAPIEDSASISEHAEQFSPDISKQDSEISARELANTGQFADRHPDGRRKAQSQRATPEDVAEINRLTRELRETEQRIGEKDPDAKASPRIRTLKRQIAALKALDTPAREEPKPAAANAQLPRQPVSAPGEFTEKEPNLGDFDNHPDPLAAWTNAVFDYKWKKNEFDRAQAAQAEAAEQAKKQATEEEIAAITRHNDRLASFAQSKPDFYQATAEFINRKLPDPLIWAVMRDDNGPSIMYYLAQHPDVVDVLHAQTAHLGIDAESVALAQRLVRQQVQAASTGSAAPARPTYTPPRPPNPVRTGPVKTSDEPPGEASSIADHAKYYDPSKRR